MDWENTASMNTLRGFAPVLPPHIPKMLFQARTFHQRQLGFEGLLIKSFQHKQGERFPLVRYRYLGQQSIVFGSVSVDMAAEVARR